MLYLFYFQLSSILFVYYIDKVMISRGYYLVNKEKISLFIVMALSTQSIYLLYKSGLYFNLMEMYRLIYIFPFLIIISLIDVVEKNVYDEDIINAIIIEIGIIFLSRIESQVYLVNILCGAGTLFVATLILSYVTKSLGTGDVLLYLVVGSFGNVSNSIIIFLLSFILAAMYAIPMYMFKKNGDKIIAFTPFISVGFIITTLFFKVF